MGDGGRRGTGPPAVMRRPKQKVALTKVERRTLRLVANGSTYEEVAALEGVSRETVKTRLQAARKKLGARSTTHAVALAQRAGLFK